MITARFSAVWQVGLVAAAALGCYLVSQTVAGERAALLKVDRRITATADDIRRLETEIGARSRMAQLERWNREVLALGAPRPRQFVANGVQLASLYGRYGRSALPLDPAIVASKGAIDTVAYRVPDAAPAPAPVIAPAQPPAPIVSAPIAPAAADPVLLRHATFVRARPTLAAEAAAPVVRAAYKPRASLLPSDIGSLAAAEKAKPAARDDGRRDRR